MRLTETIPADPLKMKRSIRKDRGRVLTSGDAGKILPLKYIPMLREDAVQRGRVRINVEMQETAELLMNQTNLNVYAHYVPMLAFDRFNGSMEELNRSYKGETGIGGSVVPFFETNKRYVASSQTVDDDDTSAAGWDTVDLADPDPYTFYQTMGMHFAADNLNMTVVEAYNAIVNHRRQARSKSLPLRNAYDHSLAEAFWNTQGVSHIVPDFDQLLIDGEVSLRGLTFNDQPVVWETGQNRSGKAKLMKQGNGQSRFAGDQGDTTNDTFYTMMVSCLKCHLVVYQCLWLILNWQNKQQHLLKFVLNTMVLMMIILLIC